MTLGQLGLLVEPWSSSSWRAGGLSGVASSGSVLVVFKYSGDEAASSAGAKLLKCCQCSPFIVRGADAIVRPSSVIHARFMRDPCVFHARTVRDSSVLVRCSCVIHTCYIRYTCVD